MKKRSKLKKGLAILLSLAMVVGLMPGAGTMKASAAEATENTISTVSSNDVEVPEQTGELTPEQTDGQETNKLITTWQWIDEEEYIDEETGSLALPGASEQTPAYFEDVTAFLPIQIKATVVSEYDSENPETGAAEETITLGDWACEEYPEEGAYTGSYTFTATLPEGYELSEEAEALTVTVELGGAQTYETTGADGYDNGFCTTYNASEGSCSNTSHENCSGYQPATDSDGDSVYEIGNAGQLYWFAGFVNGKLDGVKCNTSANAVLTSNITVNIGLKDKNGLLDSLVYDESGQVTNGNSFTSWTPIGNIAYNYTGTFDGQEHTISGLYFNDTKTTYVGLFGWSDGTIKNVGVVDSYFSGQDRVGGVCGKSRGSIENSYNTGTVSGTSSSVGGVCGYSSSGSIENSHNTGAVSGTGIYVGGVCGYSSSSIIKNN